MHSFPRPEKLNGAELIAELLDAEVRITDDADYPYGKVPPTDKNDGFVYLEINEEDAEIAADVVANHVGTGTDVDVSDV